MASLVALLMMMSFLALWIYVKFPPVTGNARALRIVNRLILGLAVVMAGGWVARVYATYDLSVPERALVAQFAAFGGLAFFLLVICLGFLVRNFLIFKPDRFYR